MNARILTSPYPHIQPGTIGEVIGTAEGLICLRVDCPNPAPGVKPSEELGKADYFFEPKQIQAIKEEFAGVAMEAMFVTALNWMANAAHSNSRAKGFWNDRDAIEKAALAIGKAQQARKMANAQMLALIHSEVSEALEGERGDLMDDKLPAFTMLECELADVLIRIGDMMKGRELRVAQAVVCKMAFNSGRPAMHGKNY